MTAEPGGWADRAHANLPAGTQPGRAGEVAAKRAPLTQDEVAAFLAAFFALCMRAGHPALRLHPGVVLLLAQRSDGARHMLRRLVEQAVFVARLEGSPILAPAHVEAAWLTFQQTADPEHGPPQHVGETAALEILVQTPAGQAAVGQTPAGQAAVGQTTAGQTTVGQSTAGRTAAPEAEAAPAVAALHGGTDAVLRAPASLRLPSPSTFTLANRPWGGTRMLLCGSACAVAALGAGVWIGLVVQPLPSLPRMQLADAMPGAGASATVLPGIVAAVPIPAVSAALAAGPPLGAEPPGLMANATMPLLLPAVRAPVPAAALPVDPNAGSAGVLPGGASPPGAAPPGAAPAEASLAEAAPAGAVPVGAMPVGAMPVGAVPVGILPVGMQPAGMQPAGTTATDVLPAGALPRVYVVYPRGNADAAIRATQTVRVLRAARYEVAEPQQVAEAPAHEAEIAYFFVEDAASAAAIAQRLGGHVHLTALATGVASRPGTIRIDLPTRGPASTPEGGYERGRT